MRRGPDGFTIAEVLIATVVASLLLTFGYALLHMSGTVYKQVSGHDDGALQMKKASRHLHRDLVSSHAGSVRVTPVAGPGGLAGDAVSALTAHEGDDGRGTVCTTTGGNPYWQRNVLYYLTRPQGDPCSGVQDADGYEDACPHKVLVRKVIDLAPATFPLPTGDPANDMEEPLESAAPYLTRPTQNLSVSSMLSEPGVTDVEVVAINLLTMRVRQNPDPNINGEVQIELRAFNEEASRRTVQIGATTLSDKDRMLTHIFSCFPRNSQ